MCRKLCDGMLQRFHANACNSDDITVRNVLFHFMIFSRAIKIKGILSLPLLLNLMTITIILLMNLLTFR